MLKQLFVLLASVATALSLANFGGSEGRSQTLGFCFYPSNAIIGPDSGLTHVITARVLDTCTGTGQEFTFDALKIDVVGMS